MCNYKKNFILQLMYIKESYLRGLELIAVYGLMRNFGVCSMSRKHDSGAIVC